MKKKILLIDDDPHFREMFAELLKRNDYEVIEASDGRYALELYNDHRPQLVITDIIMPEKEGIETILDLKKKYADIKIIAISGGGRTNAMDNLRSARLLGADFSFEKPFENKEILEAISGLTSK
ncbi:MAG: response regulator [Bacteroidales bacterium]|nr:response regulator [Bacteroidales bacterium]